MADGLRPGPKALGVLSPQEPANRMERRDKSHGDRPKSEPQTLRL